MKFKDFFIGQVIYYTPKGTKSDDTFTGIVVFLTEYSVRIKYEQNYETEFGFSSFTYRSDDLHSGPYYMTAETLMTPQERVHKRCKDLWTKSNYVKNHPNLKYT